MVSGWPIRGVHDRGIARAALFKLEVKSLAFVFPVTDDVPRGDIHLPLALVYAFPLAV